MIKSGGTILNIGVISPKNAAAMTSASGTRRSVGSSNVFNFGQMRKE